MTMTYLEAIHYCEYINSETIQEELKLQAIEKLLSMETLNAVNKDILIGVIRWFFENCVEEE